MIRFAADGILGFSVAPLRFISRLGYLISALSLVGILWVLAVRLLEPENTVPGWAFVMIVMFLLGGIQMVMLGVVGSYVGRTYVEAQRRPLYAVQLVSRSAQPNAAAPDTAELEDVRW
jgi:dolichol-phosphate mannosyltransferase